MDSHSPPDNPLRALFSGRRRWARTPVSRPVTLEGASGRYEGYVIDVSPGGVLVAVEDPAFYQDGKDGFALAARAFPAGLDVRFPTEGVARAAQVVRITPHGESHVSLGCRFEEPLGYAEAILVGAAAAGVEHPEAMAPTLPRAARPDVPVSLLLYGAPGALVGPLYVARVLAVGDRAVEAALPQPDVTPRTVAASTGPSLFEVALNLGRRRLWKGPVRLVACEAAAGGGVSLRVIADKALGPAVQRRFRPATAVS